MDRLDHITLSVADDTDVIRQPVGLINHVAGLRSGNIGPHLLDEFGVGQLLVRPVVRGGPATAEAVEPLVQGLRSLTAVHAEHEALPEFLANP